MNNNKELPKGVVRQAYAAAEGAVSKKYTVDRVLEIAQSHYEPIIEDLKKGYEPLNNQLRDALKDVGDLQEYLQRTKQGKLGSSVLKEVTKLLTEKDAKVEKLMGLMEMLIKNYAESSASIEEEESKAIAYGEFRWNQFKQEHGL